MTTPSSAPEQHASLEHLLLRFGLITLDQLSSALREQTELGTPFTEVLVRDGLVSADDLARVADRAPTPPPAAPDPEPEPEPLPPAAVVESEAVTVSEPVVEAVPMPEPVVEAEPAPEPEPVYAPPLSFAPEPVAVAPEPEPVYVPEPVAVTPEPEPEPVYVPEPVAVAPEPEPVHVPEPVAVAPEPEPVVVAGYLVRGRLVNGEEIEIASTVDAAEAQRIARDAMRACARPNGTDWPVLMGRYVRPESIVSIEVAERF